MSEPLKSDLLTIFAGLFQAELKLDAEHVFVYNQKWKIPTYSDLFLVVSFVGSKVTGVSSATAQDEAGNLVEYQSVNLQEIYQVDLFSRDASAELRKWEIPAALGSIRCQQLCDKHSFKVGRNPVAFVDLSGLEGAGMLNRYGITFNALRAHQKTVIVENFDQFAQPGLVTNA